MGLLSACAGGPARDAQTLSVTGFTLVLLLDGENQAAASEELSLNHFAFMKDIASDGQLLIAGPFGPEKHRKDLRGIFVLDESDPVRAGEVAGEDPTTKAGVFRQEVIPITTLDVIRRLPEVEVKRQERRAAKGEDLDPVSYTHLTLPTICSV